MVLKMRKLTIAKVVFLLGFIWLLFGLFMMVVVTSSTVRGHCRDLDDNVAYSAEDVGGMIHSTGSDIVRSMPWLIVPPHVLMLIAFLLAASDQGDPSKSSKGDG
jgi:hypothetical protein